MNKRHFLIIVSLTLSVSVAHGGVSPEAKCEAAKNKVVAKYGSCRQSAQAKLVATAGACSITTAAACYRDDDCPGAESCTKDTAKYADTLAKCVAKLTATWQKIEAKATAAGATCPDTPLAVEDFDLATTTHAENIASGLAGTGLQANCPADLAICNGDLTSCGDDLSTCDSSLTTCGDNLTTCNGSVTGCNGVLTTSQANLNSCLNPPCGNNTAERGEQCDGTSLNGANCQTLGFNGGTLACNGSCDFDTSGCTNHCGDGVLGSGEQCELGTLNGASCGSLGYAGGTLGCAPDTCRYNIGTCRNWGRVFVTSTAYNGNLGGLSGADDKCQAQADAAGLGSTWTAWLSTSTVDAKDRLMGGEYRLVDGTTVIVNDEWDLIDGSIDANINRDEVGHPQLGTFPWTGTSADATNSSSNCSDWTSAGPFPNFGLAGVTAAPTSAWTEASVFTCNTPRPLYCFENRDALRVFTTSNDHNGNLGGLAGGDSICQGSANSSNLGGKWRAWLSTSTVHARDRILDARYVRLDGALVANDLGDLTDSAIDAPLSLTNTGGTINNWRAYTGTDNDGLRTFDNCNDWTSTSPLGVYGETSRTDRWSFSHRNNCSDGLRLYCFEQ